MDLLSQRLTVVHDAGDSLTWQPRRAVEFSRPSITRATPISRLWPINSRPSICRQNPTPDRTAESWSAGFIQGWSIKSACFGALPRVRSDASEGLSAIKLNRELAGGDRPRPGRCSRANDFQLKEIGLPENHLATARVSFNLAVEAGELLLVGAAFVSVRAASRWLAFKITAHWIVHCNHQRPGRRSSLRTIARASIALLTAAAAGVAVAAGAPGEENTACESQSPGGDFVQFTCQLPARTSEHYWHFQANFAGGHDDTSASMTLTLDGAPLECEAGSKTRLFGEDGDVSLVCRFRVLGAAGAPLLLGVSLLWSHAQYVRTELAAEAVR